MEHQEYYIIRGDRSGVFFGQIVERKDREVTLTNCRRVWYWDGAASLSQLAAEGVKAPQSCRIAMPVEELTVLDAIELAAQQCRGAIALHGKMIDAPIVARAQRTLQMAAALGLEAAQ